MNTGPGNMELPPKGSRGHIRFKLQFLGNKHAEGPLGCRAKTAIDRRDQGRELTKDRENPTRLTGIFGHITAQKKQ